MLAVVMSLWGCGPFIVGEVPESGPYPEPYAVEASEVAGDPTAWATVIDIREHGEAWERGHVPGSIPASLAELFPYNEDDDPQTEAAELARGFAALGVEEPVLVVGDPADGWGEDGWAWWLLRYAGYDDVMVMLGGFPDYELAGGAVEEAGEPDFGSAEVPEVHAERSAIIEDVEQYLELGYLVLDTRTQQEWDEGHIAGAVFWEHGSVFSTGGRLRSAEELREELAGVGLTELDQPAIIYCAGGFRSGHNVWVTELMGHTGVRNFRGSFWTWEAQGMPVETARR